MSYQYGQEARDRISAFGLATITEFIEEVPHAFRKSFYDRQPAIPGFRRGSPPEFKEKQKRLIAHLIHPQQGQKGEADWKAFSSLWVAWAKSRLDTAFPTDDNASLTPDAGPVFFKKLADLFPDAPREIVDRLSRFSGFADHSDMQIALALFHPASTLARDRMIDGLPGRLHKIEGYFEITEAAVEDVADRIDQLELDSTSLIKSVEQVASNVSIATADVAELRATLDRSVARAEKLEKLIQSLDTAGKFTSEAVAASDIQAEQITKDLETLSVKAKGWDNYSSEISELRQAVDRVSSREAKWTDAATAVDLLAERLDALETNFAKVGNGSGARQQIRLFEIEPQDPFVELTSLETACDLIARNLQASGIVKGASTSMARQILAAVIAGQLVQFTGSLADLVADAVAAAVGGPAFHEWRVPVGLGSDEAATDCLEVVAESSGCLLMKGANRSAFEVYGTAIRDVIARRQFSMPVYDRLVFIASWTQGPAAFPDGGTLAELGPVFDTDALQMRGVSAKLPGIKFGHLTLNSWDHIQGFDDETPRPPITNLRESLEEANFAPGNLWMRSADRAYVRLRMMPGGSAEGDLHALLMFWVTPWAKALAGPTEEIARIASQLLAQTQAETAHLEGV